MFWWATGASCKGTLRKMRQNLGWAIGYNTITAPIAAGAFAPAFGLVLHPEIAALSMSGSSLIVAVNALLLVRLKLPLPTTMTPQAEAESVSSDARLRSWRGSSCPQSILTSPCV